MNREDKQWKNDLNIDSKKGTCIAQIMTFLKKFKR